MAANPSGMRGNRSRDHDGELRQKRADTQIGTIEPQYGVDFGRRSDMKLGTLREETGLTDMKDILKLGE